LEVLTNLGIELNEVKDLDILMEHILAEARRFVNADAGSIYIREDDQLLFTYTQNATLQKRLSKGEKLLYTTFSIPIDQESIAGFSAVTGQTINVADVYKLDSIVPYRFRQEFDETSGYETHSVLALPLKTVRGDTVGVLQLINALDESGQTTPFSEEDERMMSNFASTATLALERAQMTRALILRMIRMAELRDPKETGAHVNRVASCAVEIYECWANKKGVPQKEIATKRDTLRIAAMLHDVGKVAISDQILKKPGRLTQDEFEIMKGHTVSGARLFFDQRSDFDEAAAVVALNHHERWNGKGYPGHIDVETGTPKQGFSSPDGKPLGKKGDEIPLLGRIVAIADVYDALSSKRVYKEAWEESETLKTMEQEVGQHFDPELMEAFLSSLDQARSARKRYPDEDEEADAPGAL
jgi:HD-GYP domain-containing protein (c-di-GMP phosphodiesterase class II)